MAYTTIVAFVATILTVEAQLLCQDPNEINSPCFSICATNCRNKDREQRECQTVCRDEGYCVCKPGYIQGWNRKCIKPEECPTCEGANEFYSCGSVCDTTCATLGETCPWTSIVCNEMCYCKKGFARDSKGVCIPEDRCPPRQCEEDPNAIIVPCGDPCPLTCNNKNETTPRPCPAICLVDKCKCKSGYVKDNNDKCIPASECPDATE